MCRFAVVTSKQTKWRQTGLQRCQLAHQYSKTARAPRSLTGLQKVLKDHTPNSHPPYHVCLFVVSLLKNIAFKSNYLYTVVILCYSARSIHTELNSPANPFLSALTLSYFPPLILNELCSFSYFNKFQRRKLQRRRNSKKRKFVTPYLVHTHM